MSLFDAVLFYYLWENKNLGPCEKDRMAFSQGLSNFKFAWKS
jgi:hypothetical protein